LWWAGGGGGGGGGGGAKMFLLGPEPGLSGRDYDPLKCP